MATGLPDGGDGQADLSSTATEPSSVRRVPDHVSIMSGVRFPCRPIDPDKGYPAVKGEPLRARSCRCDIPALDIDGLCQCGYWPKATVDETWARQARFSGWAGPVSELDDYRRAMRERIDRISSQRDAA